MHIKTLNIQKNIEYLVPVFFFIILFLLPVLFTRINGTISWRHVIKIWQDQILLIPLFLINHFIFVPVFFFKKKYFTYLISILGLIFLFSFSYYFVDEIYAGKPITQKDLNQNHPEKIPPYMNLMLFSLLISGMDTGLLSVKKWNENEEKKQQLEKENIKMQLLILRNQLNPHFFLNTLNNIYSLVDFNSTMAKESIMQLSKMMRYLLYNHQDNRVKISKEFEFIKSYVDLMKLRSLEHVKIILTFPEIYQDVTIPPLLFISFIENAFKYGMSYQNKSSIDIHFDIGKETLTFRCANTKHSFFNPVPTNGFGLQNIQSRLKLLYGDYYHLSIHSDEIQYLVNLTIPIYKI